MRQKRFRMIVAVVCIQALGQPLHAVPIVPVLPYQGRLQDGPDPANGIYDLQFKLFDAATLGTQVGSTITANNIGVIDGGIAINLDFGAGAFGGSARWLEIGVRPGASTGAYTVLSPRQPITGSPYSMFAMNLPNGPIPTGAIAYFHMSSCPPGWLEVPKARGRYVVAHQPGLAPGDTAGTALTSLQDRPVGRHTHAASDSGHRHGYEQAFPNSTGSGLSQAGYRHADTDIGFARVAVQETGDVPGTNAPYIVLLVCQKQ